MNALGKSIPTIISAIAVFISILVYVSSTKSANITLSVGESLHVFYAHDCLNIRLPIVLHNTGAQPGVIRSIGVILKDQKSEEAIFFKWLSFSNLICEKNEFREVDESIGTAITVPPHSDIAKMAHFYGYSGEAQWIPKPTTYDLYLIAWTSESDKPSIKAPQSTWTFNDTAVSEIKRNVNEHSEENTYISRSACGPDSQMLSPKEFNKLVK